MAHTDVVPADRAQWSVDPFGALIRDGCIYGRGAEDTKDLLAAEMAVLVELKRRGLRLNRDVILLAEADEEAGSTGMRWLVENAWERIDAEFALNESGMALDTPAGTRIFQIQTSEKIPTRVTLTARGTAGHGAVPQPDNAVLRLARATLRLAEADQPVRLNSTTRRYLKELTKLPDYRWLTPLLAGLENPSKAASTANRIRARDPQLDPLLRTTAVPTVLRAGEKVNVIPNTAEAQIDVRRLPGESKEEVIGRIRRIVDDNAVEVSSIAGLEMPPADPSPLTTALYTVMERIFRESHPRAMVIPYMSRGGTDSAFLRARGVAAYGVPLFRREAGGDRSHGNDERRSIENLRAGAELLMKIVLAVAPEGLEAANGTEESWAYDQRGKQEVNQ
jgi:acetylornithine deacetylase/succinyl-diaminopimelate desuccinylase-like protein